VFHDPTAMLYPIPAGGPSSTILSEGESTH
jgi:hypothetical protein